MATSTEFSAAFYDREWAEQWQDMKTYSPVARHTRRMIQSLLNRLSYDSLIDIGCGNGAFLRELNPNPEKVRIAGVDFSQTAISIAEKTMPGKFHCLDIQTQSLPDVFDVGICSEVLEHLENDQNALYNIQKLCRYLIVTVPSGPLHPASKAMGHFRHYTKATLQEKLQKAGYEVNYLRAWGTPLHDPFYAWIRGQAPVGATTGHYGPLRKGISSVLYYLFFLNIFDNGHKLIALAKRR